MKTAAASCNTPRFLLSPRAIRFSAGGTSFNSQGVYSRLAEALAFRREIR
jgi:hypothetical protein